jgi:hypothetical protein
MIIEAILAINPNAEVSVNGDDINQITWHAALLQAAMRDAIKPSSGGFHFQTPLV